MTTLSFSGATVVFGGTNGDGDAISFANTTFTFAGSNNNPSFTYAYNAPTDVSATLTGFNGTSTVSHNGAEIPLSSASDVDVENITWGAGNQSQVALFIIQVGGEFRDFILQLGGTPLPTFNTLADFSAFEASVTGSGRVTSGPFAPGQTIQFLNLPGLTIVDETITGTAGDDSLSGGLGNDVIDPLGNNGFDQVFGSVGNDRIVYTNNGNDGYQQVNYDDLNAGITATINGALNTATVDKGKWH
jgi:hypothetical protein